MDCRSVKAELPAYRRHEVEEAQSVEIGRHLAGCGDCMADARDTESALALLKSIDEITPSAGVWRNLKAATDRTAVPVRRAASMRVIVRFAAAASVLVAALSFVLVATLPRRSHAATVSFVAPDTSDLRPGTPLRTGDTFRAPTYVVLTLPDIGLIKLNRGTELEFEDPHTLRLQEGEIFAEVTREFTVHSRDATIIVHGTRFGVRADGSPSTVYVVEGKVEVASTAGRVELESGRMATVGGSTGVLDEDALTWMAQHERIMLTLEALRAGPVKQGDSPAWRLAFRTGSAAPLSLEPLKELHQQLYFRIVDPNGKQYVVRLASALTGTEVRFAPSGLIRLDVMSPCVLDCRPEPAHFPTAGRYTVTLVYQGRQGVLQSDPLHLEVR